jgi:hypothetical protein
MEHHRRVVDLLDNDSLIDEIVVEWDSDTLSPTNPSAADFVRKILSSPKLAAWAQEQRTSLDRTP